MSDNVNMDRAPDEERPREPAVSEIWDMMNRAMEVGIAEWEKVKELEERVAALEARK